MKDPRLMLVSATLALITLGGAAPWRSLPPCVLGRFEGITPTDSGGVLLGTPDPGDWGCLGGAVTGPADVGPPVPPPPTQVCMEPAYPNPTTDGAVVRFTLPSAMPVNLTVYGQTRKHGPHGAFLVHTLADRAFAAGVYQVVWDGKDDQGARVPPGLYRVVLTVAGGSVCGDIEIR